MDIKYKLEKENFVSNLHGGSISEINQVTLIAPSSVLLWSILQAKQSLFTPYTPIACLVDFLLNCAAILFATTYYSSSPLALNLALLVPALAAFAIGPNGTPPGYKRQPAKPSSGAKQVQQEQDNLLPVKPFITTYRGTMLVITCVAILAVDFRVFPRRFAKVENWGTSLMDLGVGSFVFSAGTVSARPLLKEAATSKSMSLTARLWSALRHSLPLLVLGLVRLYSVKGLDYAEHISEYGVHWNFFFTMAFIPLFVALFDAAFKLVPSYGLLAIFVAVAYQVVLDSTNLKAYILAAPRTDLLSKNREGIFSLFGYLAIFLSGQGTGTYILPRDPFENSLLHSRVLRKLGIWSVGWCLLYYLVTDYSWGAGLNVSRRLANLPYILWVNAFNCCQIAMFCLIEKLTFPRIYNSKDKAMETARAKDASSRILRAFNRNGLAIFLLANLLTGMVNMMLPTLRMNDLQAMAVMVLYIATLSGVALLLDMYNIQIKL